VKSFLLIGSPTTILTTISSTTTSPAAVIAAVVILREVFGILKDVATADEVIDILEVVIEGGAGVEFIRLKVAA